MFQLSNLAEIRRFFPDFRRPGFGNLLKYSEIFHVALERALVFLKTCHSIFGLDEISELKIIKRVKNLSDAKQPGTVGACSLSSLLFLSTSFVYHHLVVQKVDVLDYSIRVPERFVLVRVLKIDVKRC